MKRFLLAAAVVLITLALAACGGNTAPTQASVTEAPTDAPYIDTQISEPEWTLAERVVVLQDDAGVVASGDDILYFAIISKNNGQQELLFRLSDETAEKLAENSSDSYTVTLDGPDGAKVGTATLNSECTIATITAENTEGEITAWASVIRGLSE